MNLEEKIHIKLKYQSGRIFLLIKKGTLHPSSVLWFYRDQVFALCPIHNKYLISEEADNSLLCMLFSDLKLIAYNLFKKNIKQIEENMFWLIGLKNVFNVQVKIFLLNLTVCLFVQNNI